MTRTEYTIVATNDSADARDAAWACNKELMAAGDTYSREAAEEKMAECAASLQEWLAIEAEEISMKTAKDVLEIIREAGADSDQAILYVLNDGSALAAMGITDADQEAVEEAADDIRRGR